MLLFVNRLSTRNPGIKTQAKDPYVRMSKILPPTLDASQAHAGLKISTMAVCGNHGYISYDNHDLANFDILTFDRTKLLLSKYNNIDYNYSNSFMEVVNILNHNILMKLIFYKFK